jgi:hypothetical protein
MRFCMVLQWIGVGGEHGAVLAAFLNLPDPRKWRHDFNVLEKFMYDALEKTKGDSQHKAVRTNDVPHPK